MYWTNRSGWKLRRLRAISHFLFYHIRIDQEIILSHIQNTRYAIFLWFESVFDRSFHVAVYRLSHVPGEQKGPASHWMLDGQNLLFQHCVIKFYFTPLTQIPVIEQDEKSRPYICLGGTVPRPYFPTWIQSIPLQRELSTALFILIWCWMSLDFELASNILFLQEMCFFIYA